MYYLKTHENEVQELKFTHLVEVPSAYCVIATAKDTETGKVQVYLLTKDKVYYRNGLKQTWEEIEVPGESTLIRDRVRKAINDKSIPYFKTNRLASVAK